MLIENRDYMFIEHPENNQHYAIKLLSGPYEGVTYCYTKFKGITEDDVRLSAVVSFEYQIIDDLNLIADTQHFISWIGDVLTSHVTNINQSENPQEQMTFDNEETRNNNSTEPNSE